jgi:hypothetical protein
MHDGYVLSFPDSVSLHPGNVSVVRKKLVMTADAVIQRLKSLGYEIHPCISSCGPARGCSLKLMDSVLNIAFSVMARRASHRDVTSKSSPGRFSPAKSMPE